jgi:hypothetical protein
MTPARVLGIIIAVCLLCLAVLVWGILTRAEAAIHSEIGSMFCGSSADLRAALHDYRVTMRGPSGSRSDKIAEIWTDAAGNWFAIQIVPAQDLYCVVMGGNPGLKPVDDRKEGDPA